MSTSARALLAIALLAFAEISTAQVPTLSINDVSVTEGNSGSTTALFTITLTGSTAFAVTVNYETVAGTATAGSDFASPFGTVMVAPGTMTQTITVPVVGDTTTEPNETFFVNLSGAVNATIADSQGQGTIVNDDAAPTLAIFAQAGSVVEGNSGTTNALFNVALIGSTAFTVTVNYATADGTATAGTDYTATSGTLTFAPGTTTQTITVPVVGDAMAEPNETFFVNLSGAANATITGNQAQGMIANDDSQPTLSIDDISIAEGNSGTTNAEFTVTLSGSTAFTVTVDFSTQNGTAMAGDDYTATSGTVTFPPGTSTQPITVAVIGDVVTEPDETFLVDLHPLSATNAMVIDTQARATILNDDQDADLGISKTAPVSAGKSGPVSYNITVTNAGPGPATNVVVSDAIPAGTTFESATASQGTCSGTTTVTCSVGALVAGGTATIALHVTAPAAPGPISNTATVSAAQTDPDAANNSSSATTDVLSDIPTLSEWMLMAMAGVLAVAGAFALRR